MGTDLVLNNVGGICSKLSPRQEELMKEFMAEEEELAKKGESSCKSHTFSETVRDTVNRIKKFVTGKSGSKDESS
jgi:hypothetical protein